MRILLTVTGAWGTGSFQVAEGVADTLVDLGHEVKIFFPDAGMESSDRAHFYSRQDRYSIWSFPIQNEEARLETFPLILTDPNPRSLYAKTFKQLSAAERSLYFGLLKEALGKVIQDFKPDVIECQHIWAMDHVVGSMGLPFISVAHNSDQLAFDYDETMRDITRQSATCAQYIFAISDPVRKRVIELYGVKPEKVITIPAGYSEDVFKPMDLDRSEILKQFNLPDFKASDTVISFAGKLSKTKGVDTLLEAVYLLPDDVHTLVMGSGQLEAVLTPAEIDKLCSERVYFLGHLPLDQVALIDNISDLAVIPSRSEGFCIAGLEVLACGTPLIMTQGAHAGSYVVEEEVPTADPVALAEAIKRFLSRPDADKKAASDRALVSAGQFSWKALVEERLSYYQLVIDTQGSVADKL